MSMRTPYRRIVLALLLAAGVFAAPAGAADLGSCAGATGPCVSTTSTPDTVSIATTASTTYIRYQATVYNGGGSTMTHVVVNHALPPGTTLQNVSTDTGTCTAGTTTCSLGDLASRQAATVTVNVTGPASAGTIVDTIDTSFSAGGNPGSDPKRDIISRQATTVSATAGQAESWVPPDTTTSLSTDPTGTGVATRQQSQVAGARIQAPAAGVFASLKRTPGAFACPKGDVCRGGDWIEARALIDGVPGFFDPPLRFTLRWDATLVPKKQSVRNLAVFYEQELGAPLQVISRRCSSATPAAAELPCLTEVTEQADGDFSAVLVQNHNGYMR
jgi:uncharacterized repeat protein (TIGR01451 family)